MSEEQIVDIFSRVGQVINFRLVHDKETGRPKGFGFLEFADPDAAASAVRNLNDHEIMNRKLRVDWSNDNSGGGGGGDNAQSSSNNNNNNTNSYVQQQQQQQIQQPQFNDIQAQPSVLPPLPPGIDVPPGLTAPDAISKTLSAIPAPQLLDIISQMKGLVMTDPGQATELLRQAPQLAYAMFQALLLLGLVDTSMLGQIVQAAAPPANPSYPASAQPVPPPIPQPPQAQYGATPQPPYPGYPPQFPQQHATPPVQQPAYPPPPQQQAAMPSQQDLIAQVMAMTREQVFSLDPAARDQIVALRAQLGAPLM